MKVVVRTPVIGNKSVAQAARLIIPRDKYPEEILEHIDKYFLRVDGKVALPGDTVAGAIKRALGLQGVPTKFFVPFILFDERWVTYDVKKIILPSGRESLKTYEFIIPGATAEFDAPELYDFLIDLTRVRPVPLPLEIQIGESRKFGYGRVLLYWAELR